MEPGVQELLGLVNQIHDGLLLIKTGIKPSCYDPLGDDKGVTRGNGEAVEDCECQAGRAQPFALRTLQEWRIKTRHAGQQCCFYGPPTASNINIEER